MFYCYIYIYFMGNPTRILLLLMLPLLLFQQHTVQAQQTYVDNKQLDCDQNYTTTIGYVCNGAAPSCASYLTFRSNPTYDSPASIGHLLGAGPSDIARINDISNISTILPTDTLLIVPLNNCSCSGEGRRRTYQHNASYVLKNPDETYFILANNTFQGLTTCQSLSAQNPYNFRQLSVGIRLTVPLRCACPTSNQTAAGLNFLLTYLVTWGDTISSIGDTFGVDQQTILQANDLFPESLIYPFTPILVPLPTQPTKINTSASPPPPPPSPPLLPTVPVGESNSFRKWVFVGVGIGAACLLLLTISGFLVWSFLRRRSAQGKPSSRRNGSERASKLTDESAVLDLVPPERKSWSVSPDGVRYAIESLTVYKFEELQKATGYFGEANRIKGGVYRGTFNGDTAAVKMMKGDVSGEINILKHINHSNIIRLSGFCLHQGNTYLVYEYADNGSLSEWLHLNDKNQMKKDQTSWSTTLLPLGWRQRVQIAHDVADALNFLHIYSSPPYIHKNLKSSNILLDGNWRAKIANFGLARTLESQDKENEEEVSLQLTRHVVGTQGYMAPEYIQNGLITPKLDVFAFGVVMLELLSGREAAQALQGGGGVITNKNGEEEDEKGKELLSATITQVLGGENVREKLRDFMDPYLRQEYPLELAYSMAQLARNCVAYDLNSRPTMPEVSLALSKILSSSLDWDPSDQLDRSTSLTHGR